MAFEIWGGYLAYAIGYAIAAAFLVAYRRDIVGRSTLKAPSQEYRHAAEAA